MSADPAPWRRQSSQISGNGVSSPSPGPPPGAPPPPPPPYAPGSMPSARIPTEMVCRKEPPAAIQNAMMTKDKKPFTYTPGGLDLNEIRSPRMAKRISRNAHLEDSCTGAAASAPPPPVHPQQLPPQTLAAMQPQIAVAVLPTGTKLPKAQASPPVYSMGASGPAPPPPPPMPFNNNAVPSPPTMPNNVMETAQGIPNSAIPSAPPMPNSAPPPPPMPSSGGPPPPPPLPANGALSQKPFASDVAPSAAFASQSDTLRRSQPRPDYIADIANHAHTLKRVNQPPRSLAEQQAQNFPQIQLRQTGFHHRSQSNDENASENDETDKIGQIRGKTPSPPKFEGNEGLESAIEQPTQVKTPVPQTQQVTRPNFQQGPRPISQVPTPSPPVNNQPKMFRPQMPQTPTTPDMQRQKYSPPRTSPPREPKFPPQMQSSPMSPPMMSPPMMSPPMMSSPMMSPPMMSPPMMSPPMMSPPMMSPSPTVNNQQRGFRPQGPPSTPEVVGPIFNQTRISPPREIVTVFQPQVFQDTGSSRQPERFQGKARPPGLKMPDMSEQAPRSTPPPSSSGLRQAPAPWMSAQRSQSKDLPPWASREESTPSFRSPPPNTIQISARIVPMQMESSQTEQQKQTTTTTTTSSQQSRVHIIPIRIEGRDDAVKPQSSQQNKYDHPDSAQMYQHVPMMQHQQMTQPPSPYMTQMPPMAQAPSPRMTQMSPIAQPPSPHMTPMSPMAQAPSPHMTQMPPMAHHQMAVAPQTPRGWSPVNSPPVQSRSFRVLQKITGSDQEAFGENTKSDGDVIFLLNRVQPKKEAPVYSEMMSPPVYTMPPSYQPQFYNMRSPTYDSNGHPGESEY